MLQKILNRIPLMYGVSVALFIIAPLCYIARYNHAGADDYEVSRLLVQTQSIWQTAMVLMERSASYTGVFLQALLQPADVEGIGFKIVPIGVMLAYWATFYAGIAALLPHRIQTDERILFALACFAVFFRLMESPMQTLFWSMSAIGYTSGYVLAVLFIVVLAQYLCSNYTSQSDSNGNPIGFVGLYAIVVVAMLLALGSLPVVSLLTLGLCAGGLLYALLNGYKSKYMPLAFVVLLAVAVLWLMLTAAGSLRRMAESGYQGWADRPILAPMIFALNMYRDYLAKWLSDSLMMISSLAFLAWLTEKRIVPQLRLPVWLPFATTVIFGYLWFFVPKLLVGYIAARQKDTALVFFLTGWVLSLVYLAAFLQKHKRLCPAVGGWRVVVFGAMLLTLLLPQYTSNMRLLWVDIRSGAAARHDAEMKNRYQAVRKAQEYMHGVEEVIVLDSLQAMPSTIYKGDLEADSNDWLNRSFAGYFGVKALIVRRKADKATRIP